MVVQIFGDNAILQHAAEGDAAAAGCPGELPRHREVRSEQHRGAREQREAALDEAGDGDPGAQERPRDEAEHAETEQHAERAAMGRGRKRSEEKQQEFLDSPKSARHARPG